VHSHRRRAASAQFLRSQLPAATIVAAARRRAVRAVAAANDPRTGALGNRLAAELTAAHSSRGRRRRAGQRHALRLAGQDGAGGRVGGLLRAGRVHEDSIVFWGGGTRRRLARELPRRAVGTRHQPNADRVAAAARRPRPLHVLRRPRRRVQRRTTRRRDRWPPRRCRKSESSAPTAPLGPRPNVTGADGERVARSAPATTPYRLARGACQPCYHSANKVHVADEHRHVGVRVAGCSS